MQSGVDWWIESREVGALALIEILIFDEKMCFKYRVTRLTKSVELNKYNFSDNLFSSTLNYH